MIVLGEIEDGRVIALCPVLDMLPVDCVPLSNAPSLLLITPDREDLLVCTPCMLVSPNTAALIATDPVVFSNAAAVTPPVSNVAVPPNTDTPPLDVAPPNTVALFPAKAPSLFWPPGMPPNATLVPPNAALVPSDAALPPAVCTTLKGSPPVPVATPKPNTAKDDLPALVAEPPAFDPALPDPVPIDHRRLGTLTPSVIRVVLLRELLLSEELFESPSSKKRVKHTSGWIESSPVSAPICASMVSGASMIAWTCLPHSFAMSTAERLFDEPLTSCSELNALGPAPGPTQIASILIVAAFDASIPAPNASILFLTLLLAPSASLLLLAALVDPIPASNASVAVDLLAVAPADPGPTPWPCELPVVSVPISLVDNSSPPVPLRGYKCLEPAPTPVVLGFVVGKPPAAWPPALFPDACESLAARPNHTGASAPETKPRAPNPEVGKPPIALIGP